MRTDVPSHMIQHGNPLAALRRALADTGVLLAAPARDQPPGTTSGLPALTANALHEFFTPGGAVGGEVAWFPSIGLSLLLASRAAANPSRRFIFVGPHVVPYLSAFEQGPLTSVLARTIFVEPANAADRAFVIDAALRCSSTLAVIADGRGIEMTLSRRFQLAAGTGHSIGILLRPERELATLSAAATRWLVHPAVSPDDDPRWSVELLRCKGLRPATDARRWTVRLKHETGDVCAASDAGDRSRAACRSPDSSQWQGKERHTA